MDLDNIYKYHAPKEGQEEKYSAIRAKAKELAKLIDKKCSDSREKFIAFTALETAVMFANASIARSLKQEENNENNEENNLKGE